jgi:hypothetical protein
MPAGGCLVNIFLMIRALFVQFMPAIAALRKASFSSRHVSQLELFKKLRLQLRHVSAIKSHALKGLFRRSRRH